MEFNENQNRKVINVDVDGCLTKGLNYKNSKSL